MSYVGLLLNGAIVGHLLARSGYGVAGWIIVSLLGLASVLLLVEPFRKGSAA